MEIKICSLEYTGWIATPVHKYIEEPPGLCNFDLEDNKRRVDAYLRRLKARRLVHSFENDQWTYTPMREYLEEAHTWETSNRLSTHQRNARAEILASKRDKIYKYKNHFFEQQSRSDYYKSITHTIIVAGTNAPDYCNTIRRSHIYLLDYSYNEQSAVCSFDKKNLVQMHTFIREFLSSK